MGEKRVEDGVLGNLNDSTIERRGLRDHVYDRILELLLSGEVPPGARLSIGTIARQLGVSPTPVREAMVQLERTGLVTREALKGYRVAPPLTIEQLEQLMDARLMLETTAARLATPATEPFLHDLRDALKAHQLQGEQLLAISASGSGSLTATTEYFAKDVDFHRVVFGHCGNHYLQDMSDALGGQLHRMRQTALYGDIDVAEALEEHAAILAAYESGDPDAPEQAMRHHINQVRERSLSVERKN